MQFDREQSVSEDKFSNMRELVAAEGALAEALRRHGPRSAESLRARERWLQASVFSGSCIDPS